MAKVVQSFKDVAISSTIHQIMRGHAGYHPMQTRYIANRLHLASNGGLMGIEGYNAIIVAFCKLTAPKTAHDYFVKMQQQKLRAFPKTVCKIVDSAGSRSEGWIVKHVHNSTNYPHKVEVVNALIKNYRRCRLSAEASATFNQMQRHSLKPTSETIEALMMNASHSEVISAFKRAKRCNIPPTHRMIRLAILSCKGTKENIVLAERLHAKMSSVGLEPNNTTFDSLLNLYVSVNDFVKFRNCMFHMSSLKIPPSYGTLILTIRICQKNTTAPFDKFELMAKAAFEKAIRMNIADKTFWTAMMLVYAQSKNIHESRQLLTAYQTNVGDLKFCTELFTAASKEASS
eukprot:TRINITY_DN36788_c0_g1_i1.p1 TRINITY_DN36788_c0_g1~~TRINITY_DN36788_c0_g1_i1.p1  ORF type:complete len:344 (+),score=24.72 TRINITY_DN36788_c0_g1_i1:77-1108(+)